VTSSDILQVAIVGLGTSQPGRSPEPGFTGNGLDHALAIARVDGLAVAAVSDANLELATEAGRFLGVPSRAFEDILIDNAIDIVTISTPNESHARLAMEALNAGKHVILEKPMCISLDECRDLIKCVEDSGRKLLVNHIQRFAPRFRESKRLADRGALGDIYYAESAVAIDTVHLMLKGGWRGDKQNRHSPLLGHASHSFDLLRWIVGDIVEVRALSTSLNRLDSVDDDRCQVALVRFSRGAIGRVLGVQRCVLPMTYQLELWGTEATILDDSIFYLNDPGNRLDFSVHWDPKRPNDPMYRHFRDVVAYDKAPLIDVYEGANTVSVALAAMESVESGLAVVPEVFARR
jgi:predicted dehydrogenase